MAEISKAPRASVVIPTKDAGSGFQETLEAILGQAFPEPFDVIIIDSGSRDGTVELCRRFPVRLIQIPPSAFGHGTTRNQALAEAQGEFVALTVQDAVPADSGWLGALVQPMIDNPQVAGVYGRQVPRPDASHLAQQRNRLWYGSQESQVVQHLGDAEEWQSLSFEERRELTRFDNVTGCLRRSVWQEIPFPPYDYAEDVGWALLAIKAGYKLVYEPAARVCHSHDRNLEYEFRRAYVDARNVACILDAPRQTMSAAEAQRLLGWLSSQAESYLAALDEGGAPPSSFGLALTQADAHWTGLDAGKVQGQALDAPSLDSAVWEETWHRERFDTAAVKRLFGPDSPYPAEERHWLLAEIGWLEEEMAEEKARYRALFDQRAAHYLLGPDSPRTVEERAWLAGKLQLWSEDEAEARARYQEYFDAGCMAYLLGHHSLKDAEAQAWLADELDRMERERSRLGLRLGRPLSQRLLRSQPRGKDLVMAFDLLWDEISRDYAREAVNVCFLQRAALSASPDDHLAHLFDRLGALGVLDLVKEAIGHSLRSGIEAALAGEQALSRPELDFIFYNLWTRLGNKYVKGIVADLTPQFERVQLDLIKQLDTGDWQAGQVTREIISRAGLYAAATITASTLGLAARAALAASDENDLLAAAGGVGSLGPSVSAPDESPDLWQRLQALLDRPWQEAGFWADLDRAVAQGV